MVRALLSLSLLFLLFGCGTSTSSVKREVATSKKALVKGKKGWPKRTVKRCEAVVPLLKKASQRSGLDHALLVGIVKVESTFRPDAVSSVGALGLMQVMPLNGKKLACGDLREPEANIACGVRVLQGFLRYYRDDIVYALSGYNAGFAMPNLARRQARLPKNKAYVEKVLAARASYLRHGCGS